MEWRQAKDEGKDVDGLKEICKLISKKAPCENYKDIAERVLEKLISADTAPDYPFDEPSELPLILSARPLKRHCFSCEISREELAEKISGAWLGRISGCLLGKPVEGVLRERLTCLLKLTDNYPMHKFIAKKGFTDDAMKLMEDRFDRCWIDNIDVAAPVDDDTNYTVLSLKLVETFGSEFRPDDVIEAWLSWMPFNSTFTAERIAYRNAAMGMCAPQTAIYKNPCREWIGAQIRGDFFGYINPANPEKAAEMAWRDASVSHTKNGIYGEMFVSAMIASACVCNDIMKVIEAGLDEIPERCRLRRDIDLVVQWYRDGLAVDDVIEKIHNLYDENDQHDWCHTNSNAMIVVTALLYGGLDFGKSICLAVQSAFDTDCNGATVGSIVGIMIGAGAIPDNWISPFKGKLLTSISGYAEVSVEELVRKTLALCSFKSIGLDRSFHPQ